MVHSNALIMHSVTILLPGNIWVDFCPLVSLFFVCCWRFYQFIMLTILQNALVSYLLIHVKGPLKGPQWATDFCLLRFCLRELNLRRFCFEQSSLWVGKALGSKIWYQSNESSFLLSHCFNGIVIEFNHSSSLPFWTTHWLNHSLKFNCVLTGWAGYFYFETVFH